MRRIDSIHARFSRMPPRRKNVLLAVLVGALILVGVYPDVIFFGKSFRATEIDSSSPFSEVIGVKYLSAAQEYVPRDDIPGRKDASSWIPEPPTRTVYNGSSDTGGAVLQWEPTQYFMRNVLYEGESPFWNPYLSAGAAGPESLNDGKFSLLTVTIALLGASSLAFHVVKLSFLFAGVVCLYLTIVSHLKLARPAAVAGCLVYVLNGFAQSQQHSLVGNPYLLTPVVLYAVLSFHAHRSTLRFVIAVAAHAVLLFESFIPTTLLAMVAIHGFSFAYLLTIRKSAGELVHAWMYQTAIVVFAVLLSSPLWFPYLDNMKDAWEYDYYQNREDLFGAKPEAFLSVFTPRHFWESYSDNRRTRPFGNYELELPLAWRFIYHVGIIPCVIAVYSFRMQTRFVWFRRCALLFFAFGVWRVFPLFPMDQIIHVPVLKIIRAQYWGLLWCFSFTFLVAFGTQALLRGTLRMQSAKIVYAAIAFAFFLPMTFVGIPDNAWTKFYLATIWFLVGVSAFLLDRIRKAEGRRRFALVLTLLAVMFVELHWYTNHYRNSRIAMPGESLKLVAFLKENVGEDRVFNMGLTGLTANWGSAFQIPQIGNVNSMQWRHYHQFYSRNFPGLFNIYTASRTPVDFPNELAMDLLGARYLVVCNHGWIDHREKLAEEAYPVLYEDPRVWVYENVDAFPRAFTVPLLVEAEHSPVGFGTAGATFATTQDKPLLKAAAAAGVSVETGDPGWAPPASEKTSNPAPATIAEYHNARVVIETATSEPAVLVLMDTWHPDWKVTIDGEEAYVGRVNEAFRGVVVPAGEHRIAFTFTPRTLPAALAAVSGTLLLLLLAVLLRRRIDALFAREPQPLEDEAEEEPYPMASRSRTTGANEASN